METIKFWALIIFFKLLKLFIAIKIYLFPNYEIRRRLISVNSLPYKDPSPTTLSRLIFEHKCKDPIVIEFMSPDEKKHKLIVDEDVLCYYGPEIHFNEWIEKNEPDKLKYDVDVDTMELYLISRVTKDGELVSS